MFSASHKLLGRRVTIPCATVGVSSSQQNSVAHTAVTCTPVDVPQLSHTRASSRTLCSPPLAQPLFLCLPPPSPPPQHTHTRDLISLSRECEGYNKITFSNEHTQSFKTVAASMYISVRLFHVVSCSGGNTTVFDQRPGSCPGPHFGPGAHTRNSLNVARFHV